MVGGVGHTGGLTNPHLWRGRCRAGFSNTGGPPLPRKRAPCQKKLHIHICVARQLSTKSLLRLKVSVGLLYVLYSCAASGL